MQPIPPANNNHADRTIQTNGTMPSAPIAASPFAFAAATRAQSAVLIASGNRVSCVTSPSQPGRSVPRGGA